MPGPGGMQQMLKQFQAMQSKIKKVQEELDTKEVEASAGGDMIKVRVNGKHEITSIEFKKEVVDPDDVEMLQDLVIAAVNEAIRKAKDMSEKEMAKVSGLPNIPGMPDLGNMF